MRRAGSPREVARWRVVLGRLLPARGEAAAVDGLGRRLQRPCGGPEAGSALEQNCRRPRTAPCRSSMLINARTAIDGEACTLVPYCRHHVPVYHGWMQDPYVLGAQPAPLRGGHGAQPGALRGRNDCIRAPHPGGGVQDAKELAGGRGQCVPRCTAGAAAPRLPARLLPHTPASAAELTFIILDNARGGGTIAHSGSRSRPHTPVPSHSAAQRWPGTSTSFSPSTTTMTTMTARRGLATRWVHRRSSRRLRGHAAFPLVQPASAPNAKRAAEIEVMVAEQGSRRKGLAREALRLMMAFGASSLGGRREHASVGASLQVEKAYQARPLTAAVTPCPCNPSTPRAGHFALCGQDPGQQPALAAPV